MTIIMLIQSHWRANVDAIIANVLRLPLPCHRHPYTKLYKSDTPPPQWVHNRGMGPKRKMLLEIELNLCFIQHIKQNAMNSKFPECYWIRWRWWESFNGSCLCNISQWCRGSSRSSSWGHGPGPAGHSTSHR